MEIALLLLGILGCLLSALAARVALHEICHRFDGERTGPSGGSSTTSYWLTFRPTDAVTFGEGKEAFHDSSARFGSLESATHDSAAVNAKRKERGDPPYTVIHGSDGGEWPLRED